jgi:hypothetical protein
MSSISISDSRLLAAIIKDDVALDELDESLSRMDLNDTSPYTIYLNKIITKSINSLDKIFFINCQIDASITCVEDVVLINSVATKSIKSFNNLFIGSRSKVTSVICKKVFFVFLNEEIRFLNLDILQLELIVSNAFKQNTKLSLKFNNSICNFQLLVPPQIKIIYLIRNCFFKAVCFLVNDDRNKVIRGESSRIEKVKNGSKFYLTDSSD